MKKNKVLLIILVFLALLLGGCALSSIDSEASVDNELIMIYVCDAGNQFSIYKEKYTDIMYLQNNHQGYHQGGTTVMLDTDGKPLTYTKWLTLKK